MTLTTYAPPMALFVVVYDRSRARTIELRQFDADGERVALELWRQRELDHLDDPDIEVVLLDAASEDDLRRTHGRYFDLGEEIAKRRL